MTRPDADPTFRGYLTKFEMEKVFEAGRMRLDLTLVLAEAWEEGAPQTAIQFTGVQDVRFGDQHEGINFGSQLFLKVSDVSAQQWEGIRYRVANLEQDLRLAFYCRGFEKVHRNA